MTDYPYLETRLEYLEKPVEAPKPKPAPEPSAEAKATEADLTARLEVYKRGGA